MTIAGLVWYFFAVTVVVSTIMALRARQPVHAILWLVSSLFGMAVLFFMLSAPIVAVFEVILYAGAIMVLFLFVIMMLDLGHPERYKRPPKRCWLPPVLLSAGSLAALAVLLFRLNLRGAEFSQSIPVRHIARVIFQEHGLAVELISLQLLFALVGAFYLGRNR